MMGQINQVYKNALLDLYNNGNVVEPRGFKCKEILGYKFTLDDIADNVITLPGFETNLKYASEELKWYLAATDKITFSPLIEKVWKQFSDDGEHINSNYGQRIFGKHPIINNNQWQQVIEELNHDRDSRRAILNLNSYFDKNNINSKDVPCTIAIQLFIRNNKLDWITYMRSNDIFKGFRNDLFCFTELQKLMAKDLNVGFGNYIHLVGSMHLYEQQFDKVKKLLEQK